MIAYSLTGLVANPHLTFSHTYKYRFQTIGSFEQGDQHIVSESNSTFAVRILRFSVHSACVLVRNGHDG